MVLPISNEATEEKNKLNSDGAWLFLLKVEYPGEETGYLSSNNEEITWPTTGGDIYYPASFSVSGMNETTDSEIPSVSLSIVDLQKKLSSLLDLHGGGIGAIVTISIVHSKYLNNTIPEYQEVMEVISTAVNSNNTITFTLGAENLRFLRCPQDRYLKNHCRFIFKSPSCGYTDEETNCDRTLQRCKELNNQIRYGGFPGVGSVGIQK